MAAACFVSMITEMLIQCHLIVWTIACTCAFTFYYFSNSRKNPEFEDQLHCPSGIMLCNRLIFGFLMSCYTGAALLAVGVKLCKNDNYAALGCFMGVFVSCNLIIQFDIRQHHVVHFLSLAVFVITITAFLIIVDFKPSAMLTVYYGVTALYLFILMLNFLFLDWTPPFMTLQALAEIVWLVMVVGSVLVFSCYINDDVT